MKLSDFLASVLNRANCVLINKVVPIGRCNSVLKPLIYLMMYSLETANIVQKQVLGKHLGTYGQGRRAGGGVFMAGERLREFVEDFRFTASSRR